MASSACSKTQTGGMGAKDAVRALSQALVMSLCTAFTNTWGRGSCTLTTRNQLAVNLFCVKSFSVSVQAHSRREWGFISMGTEIMAVLNLLTHSGEISPLQL